MKPLADVPRLDARYHTYHYHEASRVCSLELIVLLRRPSVLFVVAISRRNAYGRGVSLASCRKHSFYLRLPAKSDSRLAAVHRTHSLIAAPGVSHCVPAFSRGATRNKPNGRESIEPLSWNVIWRSSLREFAKRKLLSSRGSGTLLKIPIPAASGS